MAETIKEMCARWRLEADRGVTSSRNAGALLRSYTLAIAETKRALAKELEGAKITDLICPDPSLKGKVCVVLYVETEADALELEEAFKAAKPNYITRTIK